MECVDSSGSNVDLTQIEDRELVVLATECGYHPAQHALVLRYHDWCGRRIRWLAHHRGLTETETEDAVQDAVFGILKAIGRYDALKADRHGGCQFHTFLNRVLTDRFKDFVKQLRRSNRRCQPVTSATKGVRTDSDRQQEMGGVQHWPDKRWTSDPAAVLERKELLARLHEAMEQLPDTDRRLIEAYLSGVRWQVLACDLGLSYDAAKHRSRALRRRLALELGPCLS